jgi:hypothetical protein
MPAIGPVIYGQFKSGAPALISARPIGPKRQRHTETRDQCIRTARESSFR